MKRYRIVHTARMLGDGPESSDPNGPWGWPVDDEDRYTEALFLARLYAQEHADRLDVEVTELEHGAEFTTHNGSLVRYEVTSLPL